MYTKNSIKDLQWFEVTGSYSGSHAVMLKLHR